MQRSHGLDQLLLKSMIGAEYGHLGQWLFHDLLGYLSVGDVPVAQTLGHLWVDFSSIGGGRTGVEGLE